MQIIQTKKKLKSFAIYKDLVGFSLINYMYFICSLQIKLTRNNIITLDIHTTFILTI